MTQQPLWLAMARQYDESSAPAGMTWQDHHGYAAEIRAVRDHLFPAGRPGDDSCCDVMMGRLWDQLTTEADRAEAGDD